MRAISVASVFVLVAGCSGGSFNAGDQAAAEGQLASELAQAGVQCAPHTPPECTQACSGKNAGDSCGVSHGDDTFNGVCRSTVDGVIACAPPAAPPPTQSALDACSGKSIGDACQLGADGGVGGRCREFDTNALACAPDHPRPPLPAPFPPPAPVLACDSKQPGDACSFAFANRSFNGFCRQFGDGDGDADDVLACLPTPPTLPPGPPAQACSGKAAGDSCVFTLNGKTLNGICHQFPNGGSLLCLPPPPAPPQQTLDACVGHAAGDACSVVFRGVAVTGACEPLPDGSALACAPICRPG